MMGELSKTVGSDAFEIDQPFKVNQATAEDWRRALQRVVPAVVVLRTTAARAFDTESAGSSDATGFVVDKSRGIILTNRHVVNPGPVVAEAMFVNREEVPVYPIYRDPVHDFGFFHYDSSAIQFLSYEEIPLTPEAASAGLEIRVVGNDSGEKAASGTKGGSSGSPVIDQQGRAVAMNAGGKSSSASAFFLPLERVVRALKFLQKGRDSIHDKCEVVTVPRGTLQATFLHKGFDETRRLGLQTETEQLVRHASPLSETGMLVVESVVPGGPAHNQLEPGDVLICLNKEVTTQFLKLESLLDDSVDQTVELELERGGKLLTVKLTARNFRFQCGLVYVSDPGYMLVRAGVPRHAIIKKFAGEEISHLEDFIRVLSTLSRGARVPMEYINYTDRHRRKSVLVSIDRHEWYASPEIYKRDDNSGLWIRKQALLDVNKQLVNGVNSRTEERDQDEFDRVMKKRRLGEESYAAGNMVTDYTSNEPDIDNREDPRSEEDAVVRDLHGLFAEHEIEPTLVMFEVFVPSSCMLDGVHSQHFFGTGVIIHHSENMGLVAVDRNTVAISASDIMLSFAAFPVEIPGEVVFLHPVHNYALVAYDPSALGSAGTSAVRAAQLLPEPALQRGDPVYLVGLDRSLRATSIRSVVTNPSTAINIGLADSPRYRATNMEVIELDTDFGSSFSGVLTDEKGRVKAIWGSFSTQLNYEDNSSEDHQFVRGIPIYTISQILEKILSGAKGPPLLINGIKRPMPLGREIDLFVGTDVRDGSGSTRVINWCGCFLQEPHPAVRALGFLPDEGHGVYVTRWSHGCPSHRYGLYARQWIVEVNGKPTPDLEAFVNVTKEIGNGEFVRLKTVNLNGKRRVLTLKQDLHYWPTWELRFDPDTAMWQRKTIKSLGPCLLKT
ncbi:hypothetical protein SSX86_019142 [Deinandra increscens subsp. villosa]|uniref:Pro-apoptotic serine protease NMA111 n=1 Tax=Deinandra increscens subsp. villosa TaxID=3103831 RepID=A0AAP0CZ79_9ASTR